MQIDKQSLLDSRGRPILQGLFLELNYEPYCVYSLRDEHTTYQDKLYPSLGKLYVELEDPTEYEFANKYLYNWSHWQKLQTNKTLAKYIDQWREELEYRLRSKATKNMLEAASGGNYQAMKWIADKGWAVKGRGRPSKQDIAHEKAVATKMSEEYSADVFRLFAGEK